MIKSYPKNPSKIKKCTIPKTTLLHIGRLVRAFAEIEDLINMYIYKLAEISDGTGVVLLGRSPISRKLEVAHFLAEVEGPLISKLHKSLFDSKFDSLLECRNVVAHGILLGRTETKKFAFLTAKTDIPEENLTSQLVFAYSASSIAHSADAAEKFIPVAESALQLSAWRETRPQQVLQPHRKAQPQRKKDEKN